MSSQNGISLYALYVVAYLSYYNILKGFPGGSVGKESTCNAGDAGAGWGESPGGGLGNPLQYSCLEKPVDRGAWGTTVHGVTESQTRLRQQYAHM